MEGWEINLSQIRRVKPLGSELENYEERFEEEVSSMHWDVEYAKGSESKSEGTQCL